VENKRDLSVFSTHPLVGGNFHVYTWTGIERFSAGEMKRGVQTVGRARGIVQVRRGRGRAVAPLPQKEEFSLEREVSKQLSAEQIAALQALTYANGLPKIDLSNDSEVVEVIGLVREVGWDVAYTHFQQADPESIYIDMPTESIQLAMRSEKLRLMALKFTPRLASDVTCTRPTCRSKNVVVDSTTPGKADNPIIATYRCTSCGNFWQSH
jgi:DNA-directed RNA polymerase subunit M/transcription elongation factor TFIIS